MLVVPGSVAATQRGDALEVGNRGFNLKVYSAKICCSIDAIFIRLLV